MAPRESVIKPELTRESIKPPEDSKTALPVVEATPIADLNPEEIFIRSEEREKFTRKGTWSTKYIHDSKFNEDKQTLAFRTSKLGIFGLAANRYINLPYQNWDVRPDQNSNTVILSLSASIVNIDIAITENGISLQSLRGGPSECLASKYGVVYSFTKFKRVLKDACLDIFPDHDSFCYIETNCEKNWVMEKHLYYNLALLALTHNFAWSRWNLSAGRRNAVLLIREILGKKHWPGFNTLFVDPNHATLVDCDEAAAVLNTEPHPKSEGFFPDVYQMTMSISTPLVRKKILETPPEIQSNLAKMLQATRVLSFC